MKLINESMKRDISIPRNAFRKSFRKLNLRPQNPLTKKIFAWGRKVAKFHKRALIENIIRTWHQFVKPNEH